MGVEISGTMAGGNTYAKSWRSSTDLSTSSTSYVNMDAGSVLTLATLASPVLIVVGGSMAGDECYYQTKIDSGTGAQQYRSAGTPGCAQVRAEVVTAASHTIALMWKVTAGTAQCRSASNPFESIGLYAAELRGGSL